MDWSRLLPACLRTAAFASSSSGLKAPAGRARATEAAERATMGPGNSRGSGAGLGEVEEVARPELAMRSSDRRSSSAAAEFILRRHGYPDPMGGQRQVNTGSALLSCLLVSHSSDSKARTGPTHT